MTLIILTSNAVVSTMCANAVYVNDEGRLCIDTPAGIMYIKNIPDNALQQVAVAVAEGKSFIEFDEAELIIGDDE